MPEYKRAFSPGGTFFFTVVTARRRPILISPPALQALRSAMRETMDQRPFSIDAIVILPDHLHCIWSLPPGDADFAIRWRLIKSRFTRKFLAGGGREAVRSKSRVAHGERGIWQRRYWEHTIRDETSFFALCDYIHYNPVKHGVATCPHKWPHSSFAQFVREHRYSNTWNCACESNRRPVDFDEIEALVGE